MKLPCFTPTSWHAAICLGRQLPLKGLLPGSGCEMWTSDFPVLNCRSWWQESGQAEDNNSYHGYWGEGIIKVVCCQSGAAWVSPHMGPQMGDSSCKCSALLLTTWCGEKVPPVTAARPPPLDEVWVLPAMGNRKEKGSLPDGTIPLACSL